MAGLYIHIPFCTEKCFYCDFYSGNQLYLLDEYVNAIVKEINIRSTYLEGNQVNTIFFGGGTPSLLTRTQFARIFEAIQENFILTQNVEITIECNPENINEQYVEELYEVGFNRISLGIQFLDNTVLNKFNRRHSKELIYNALEIIENSRFNNLSVDLIYAVPGISDSALDETLEQLVKFKIKHISAYSLTISKRSMLYWKMKKGEFIESSEDVFLTQYKIIQNYCLKNGFEQYEISNYAKEGYRSIHNLAYWNQVIYMGVGISAHSYNLVSRQWNHTKIKKYIKDLKENILDVSIEQLTDIEIYNEYIILKLRTFQGISPDYINDNFSCSITDHFDVEMKKLRKAGHFYLSNELIVPRQSDLLLADYLAKSLMI